MTFNEALARAALAAIRAHPDEWDQWDWRCKTGMCFAGFVAAEAGAAWAAGPDDHDSDKVVGPNGEREHVSEFAARALGLDTEMIDLDGTLFDADNNLDDLEEWVDHFAAGHQHTRLDGAP